MRILVAASLVVSACSGGGGGAATIDAAVDGGGPLDGPSCVDCDGGGACVSWRLEDRPARAIDLYDEAAPITSARTFRVAIHYDAGRNDAAAMPTITRGAGVVTIGVHAFASTAGAGLPEVRELIVPLTLPTGAWRIVAAAPAPAPALAVTIGPAPLRPCGVAGACAMDCDCDQAAGERCLSATGLGGPFTACARPCEVDRDCGGRGTCEQVDDGLSSTCSNQPECGAAAPCPTGFACQGGACAPTFVLGQGTRHECRCDGECSPGLRCVGVTGAAMGRCEVACPTAGPWCQGAHVCGPASQDASGLAASDSVCGWLGE